jgi:hypothetical protein
VSFSSVTEPVESIGQRPADQSAEYENGAGETSIDKHYPK